MSRIDVVTAVARTCNLPLVDASRVVAALFDPRDGVIANALAEGQAVVLHRFGTIRLVLYQGRTWRGLYSNPITKGDRHFVRLKASPTLTRRLNPDLEITEGGS